MERRNEQTRMPDDPSAQDYKRAAKANEVYAKLLREKGLNLVSWDDLSAWKEYVQGQISDPELGDKAGVELDNLQLLFGKYLLTEDKGSSSILTDQVKRARAKLANKIYKKICEEKNIDVCFFSDFKSWSAYVRGTIGEAEFRQRAEEEVVQMLAQ